MNLTSRVWLIIGFAGLLFAGWSLSPRTQGMFDWGLGATAIGGVGAAVAAGSVLALRLHGNLYPQEVHCLRCGDTLGAPPPLEDRSLAGPDAASHYRDICLPCRRRLLELNQGRTA